MGRESSAERKVLTNDTSFMVIMLVIPGDWN
jgi:hypothetical protein